MRPSVPSLLLLLLLAACAPGATEIPAPTPPPDTTTPAAPVSDREPSPPADEDTARPAAPGLTEAPDAWQNLDLELDGVPGTSADRAIRELLAGREPGRTVVVAVIDGGVDTAQVDLRGALWENPDEIAGNGVDDDANGYVDDVHGWNFLGGPDGRSVDEERLEVTRLHAACLRGTTPAGYDCQELDRAFEEERQDIAGLAQQVEQIRGAMDVIVPMLQQATGAEELTPEAVRELETSDPRMTQARDLYLQLDAAGIDEGALEDAEEEVTDQLEYGLNVDFDPRGIVGDDPSDGSERIYGNADVTGPDASHGTHVAGIIAAARGNGVGMDGIAAPNVRIMSVRAVPNGDERDKDVANAIRYAVDEGADIINMSFGKSFSPEKRLVDAAVRYADENGVLLVHAAGNDGADLETEDNFPNPRYEDGGQAANWIAVGASNWVVDSLAASFSNYGRTRVDVFAPGVAILSTLPGDEWDRQDGTSMAAPVVTGVAALIMAYFPDLTASQVRDILLDSAVRYADQPVVPPGDGTAPVAFGTLSVTGGVVNAYEAVRLASQRASSGG
jgi:subtilisin family serine protease